MAQLRRDHGEFLAREAQVLVVTPDAPEALAAFWARRGMPMLGLSDRDHRVAGAYDQEVSLLKLGRMPALFVIDRAGRVRYVHRGRSMADIPPNSEVLAVLDAIKQRERT